MLFAALAARPAAAASVTLAEALLERGEVGAALDEVKARVAEAPGDVAAHELLIDILAGTGRATLARDLYRGLVKENPGNADFLYLLGRAEPDAASSRSAFEAALAMSPGHARACMGIGAVHRAEGRFAQAADAYELALNADPTLTEAWTGLRASHLGARDDAAAEAVVRRQIATFPDDLDGWAALAELSAVPSVQAWTEAVAAKPSDPARQTRLARAAFEAQQLDVAVKAYDRALALGAIDAGALRAERAILDEVRAGALTMPAAAALLQVRSVARENPDQAVGLVDQIIERHPHSGWALMVRGNLFRASGRVGEAERDLRAAVDRMPASPEAWSALGLYLLDRRRPDEAQPLLARAAEARPDDVSLVVAAAMATGQAGDVAAADAALRAATRRFPDSAGPVLGLARLRTSNGDSDGAFAALTESLRRGPDVSVAYALVSTAQETGRTADAIAILRRLAVETGDPRFAQAANGLEAAQPSPADPPR